MFGGCAEALPLPDYSLATVDFMLLLREDKAKTKHSIEQRQKPMVFVIEIQWLMHIYPGHVNLESWLMYKSQKHTTVRKQATYHFLCYLVGRQEMRDRGV